MRTLTRSILISLTTVLMACNGHDGYGGGASIAANAYNPASIPPMQVVPSNQTISAYQTLQIQPTGGVPPYYYRVQSGGGTIGYTSGQFQSNGVSSDAVVEVFDSSGKTAQVDITIDGSAPAPGAPPPASSASNCTGIMNNPGLAGVDGSTSGVGDIIGAEAISDPTDCATYCGSLGAGFCMWTPAASTVSSAYCIAWPASVVITTYHTTWATYSGTCVSSGL